MCDFTFEHYREILEVAKKSKYKIVSCIEYIKLRPKKALVLRHDVDSLPHRALEMAKIENEAGVHSTYFLECLVMNIIFLITIL